MSRTSNKRERLIDSADRLILKQGFKQTTLSDIAKDARVPLGRSDAQNLALQFTSNLQGMCLISNSLNDPEIIDRMVESTHKWLLSL